MHQERGIIMNSLKMLLRKGKDCPLFLAMKIIMEYGISEDSRCPLTRLLRKELEKTRQEQRDRDSGLIG
jgi:hypothetical protein